MKLIGELKEKVEAAESVEEVRQAIEDAGMELTDEELEGVAGGVRRASESLRYSASIVECPICGAKVTIEGLSAHKAKYHHM